MNFQYISRFKIDKLINVIMKKFYNYKYPILENIIEASPVPGDKLWMGLVGIQNFLGSTSWIEITANKSVMPPTYIKASFSSEATKYTYSYFKL